MSESQGSAGTSAATGGRSGSSGAGDGRRGGGEAGMDERSQRLLQGGAASRAWADTAARETVRTDAGAAGGATTAGGSGASVPTSTYAVAGGMGATGTSPGVGVPGTGRAAAPRRARLRISHINPLSVLKLALLFGACMLVVVLVAVAALWFVLNSAGVFSSITEATSTITDSEEGGASAWFGFGRVMLLTAVLGVLNLIAFTLLATVGALLYNLCSDFVGGVEVTLSER